MKKRTTEEIVIGAARGEPMDVEERARVAAALRGSEELRELERRQESLSADLAALRRALPELGPQGRAEGERRLREAFRARAAASAQARRARHRRLPLGVAAAALAVAAVATVWLTAGRPRTAARAALRTVPVRATGTEPRRALAPVQMVEERGRGGASPRLVQGTAFRPLAYAPSPSPWESYSVVRVRIPFASLGGPSGMKGSVEADVLVGEDGLARAIRFDRPNAPTGAVERKSGGAR